MNCHINRLCVSKTLEVEKITDFLGKIIERFFVYRLCSVLRVIGGSFEDRSRWMQATTAEIISNKTI